MHAVGCGPAVWVQATAVTSAPWVEATVYPVAGGDPITQRLPVDYGHISIGHGMCSGPFELVAGREYFAELVAVDALGRRTDADDSPIRFTAP